MSSFSTLLCAREETPTLGRASAPYLRSSAARQQLPPPFLSCASEGAPHLAGTGHSSRASQEVRQARAQHAFDTQAEELTHGLDERLKLVFTLMRQVMILDARAVEGQASLTEDYREELVGQLEGGEDAAAHTTLRFVELLNRYALEWMNQGQYSAALELLHRADKLLRKDAGRLFRYLPDPVELDAPTITGVAGGRADPCSSHNAAPQQQPAAASAPGRGSDLKGPSARGAIDSGLGVNSIDNDTTMRSMSVPFFARSQEPRRLKAAAAVDHNFGVYHFKLGEYTLASARFARSAALEEELQAPGIGITYFNMAQAQHGLRQLTEALRYAMLAEEAVERQVFFTKDKATQMQRRLTQGCLLPVANLPEGGGLARRGGFDGYGRDAAAASAPAVGHCYSDVAASLHGDEEELLIRTWLEWRENVCFLSYVKQTHADWLDEMGLYKAAYQYYREAHRWLLAVPRLALEEQQRAQLLKQCMATMKKRWRREEVEVELYQHPLRSSLTSTSGAAPPALHPSRGALSCALSKRRARMLQRPQLSIAALSAAVPMAKDFTSPLQSTVVTSVLPRAVEVLARHPRSGSLARSSAGPPGPQEGSTLRPTAKTPMLRPSRAAQARPRPSSASAALRSVYEPRRSSALLFPNRQSADDHVTAAAEQECAPMTPSSPMQRGQQQQQHSDRKPSWNPSTRVPMPPPSRRTGHHTSTERDGSAAPCPLPRRSSVFSSHDRTREPEVLMSAQLPPRPSSTSRSAHPRHASQHRHSPSHESAGMSSTSAASCVVRSLVFEAEPRMPSPCPRHHSGGVTLETIRVKGLEEASGVSLPQRTEFLATPQGGSTGAGAADLATSVWLAAHTPSALTPSFSRTPEDLTWCVTVLQAFLRSRCCRQRLPKMEVERDRSEHAAEDKALIPSHRRSPSSEAAAAKADEPSHVNDMSRAGIRDGDGALSDEQSRLLPSTSAMISARRQAELHMSQLSSVDVSSTLVSGGIGSASCRGLAAQPSSSAAVAHAPRAEGGGSHAKVVATGEDLGAHVAGVRLEPLTTPEKGETCASECKDLSGDVNGERGAVAVAALVGRGKSPIPYESDDGEASSSSAAEESSSANVPCPFYRENVGGDRGGVGAEDSTATSNGGTISKYSDVTAVASASSPGDHEKDDVAKTDRRKPHITDSAGAPLVESLDSRRRSRARPLADAVMKKGEGGRFGDASAILSKASVHGSSKEKNSNVGWPPSKSQASSAARGSGRASSLLLPEPEERMRGMEAVPASAPLLHSLQREVLQSPHATDQCTGQAHRSSTAGHDAASRAEVHLLLDAAHPTVSDRSREADLGDTAEARERALCDVLPPPSSSTAGAENSCLSGVEVTAASRGPFMRRSISAHPVEPAGGVHGAAQSSNSSATVCRVGLEVKGSNGQAIERAHEDAEGEEGATDVLSGARAPPSRQSLQLLTSPVSEGDHPHQQSRAATSSPSSRPLRSREPRYIASSTAAGSASRSHVEGAEAQCPVDRVNATATAVRRSAEVIEAMVGARPAEVVERTLQPPVTQPPRRGRVFVFVPHKIVTPVPTELTVVNSSSQSDDAKECLRFPLPTPQQSAAARDTETAEDGAAKSLLRLAGGSRTSGPSDAPLSFNEEYCGTAAMEPYATTDDETLGRHTASIGSTTTQVTQLRESFWRSTHDRSEPRQGEGGSAVLNAQQLLVKLGAVELTKVTPLGTKTEVQERIPEPSDPLGVVEGIEAPAMVQDNLANPADEDEKRVRAAEQDLLSRHETGAAEDIGAPPQRITGVPETLRSRESFIPSCSSLILAPTEAPAAVAAAEAPSGWNHTAELEMGLAAVPLSASPPPESPGELPEMLEAPAGMLSPRHPPLAGERHLPRVGSGAREAVSHGEGGESATAEGEEVGEKDTHPPANQAGDGNECAHRSSWLGSEGARGSALATKQLSLKNSTSPRPPEIFPKPQPQQHHRHRAPSSGVLPLPVSAQWPTRHESTWSDLEMDEAQRRYISDQIVQEEAATVIQQAWRDHVATRLRRQLYLLL
ncbi:hypothetical protein LSCM1_01892 [Leishmania martiniquensis]|uniref:Uncharacterized protein n=1 Tax=Leishmania martiniquensis TaxID=1580590 RepID=A0A836KE84_9TRYP|nr:hypothetical protein LSCM1_01892 [Leishmania martiniquensis]